MYGQFRQSIRCRYYTSIMIIIAVIFFLRIVSQHSVFCILMTSVYFVLKSPFVHVSSVSHVSLADIDECLQHPCHTHATCENTDGNYTCTCKELEGYVGDGFICNRKSNSVLSTSMVRPY